MIALSTLVTGFSTGQAEIRTEARTAKPHSESCRSARKGIVFYRAATHEWQRKRQAEKLADHRPMARGKPCSWVRYAVQEWKARARNAREAHARWVQEHTLREYRDWQRAVTEVQRAYPGTEAWLLSCSASEGAHGLWVPNRQGSGAGGWLQFMESTFWRMYGAAMDDVRSRGFFVPSTTASWYSPLGQALAGAWGVSNGRRGEWSGGGC